MRSDKKIGHSRTRVRYRVLATAALSTLAATGFAEAVTLVPTIEHTQLPGSIGYIGPVPVNSSTTATGNTFDIAVIGFNITNDGTSTVPAYTLNDAAYLVGPEIPTFGTTKTITNATADGETATITSKEVASKGKTTDTVTFSVPTAFVPAGSSFTDGDVINEEDLEIGFDAGTTGLTFSLPVSTVTTTGKAVIGNNGGSPYTFSFSSAQVYTTLTNGNTNLNADEGLSNFTDTTDYTAADLTQYDLRSFSFTFSYTTPVAVPEPTAAALAVVAGATLLRRRSRVKPVSIVDLASGLVDEPMSSSASPGTASHADDAGTANQLV